MLTALTGPAVLGFIDNFVRADGNVGGIRAPSFLGIIHRLSRYRIRFAHTAKYKNKLHAAAIHTNQIAILPNLGTFP
jgi:hypothetical protein